MLRRIAALAALLIFAVPFVLLGEDDTERKEGTHYIDKIREHGEGDIVLLPDFSFSDDIRLSIESHKTTYLVEWLYTLPALPPGFATLDTLAALMLDVDSLEGIEYWSGGRGRMYPYIKKSYRVESPDSRNSLPPLNPAPAGTAAEFIQYQKDTSFGANWYEVSVEVGTDAVLMTTVNLTELKAFTKKTADAGGVLLQMSLIPREEDALLYCAVAMKEFPPLGWSPRGIAGSFDNRISALEAWFADRIYGME